jgi:hypothetical protein
MALRSEWDKRERNTRKTKDPKFFTYFNRNIAVDMKEKMLLPVRRNAGLGDNFYYNNASESMHDRIKKRIRQIKRDANPSGNTDVICSLTEMVEIYQEITEECRRNVHRAIIDQGPYKLDDSIAYIQVSPSDWRDMSAKEKERRIKMIDPLYKIEVTNNSLSHHQTTPTLEAFERSGLPSMFCTSWENANTILRRKGVSDAPGSANVKVVLSLTDPATPHFVTAARRWKAMKCNCKGYEQRGLCAHIIAVAHLQGTLLGIVSQWKPNLAKQVTSVAPKRVGQKPGPKRNRHLPVQRNVNPFGERVKLTTPATPQEDMFSVVAVSSCKATTCYGCSSKFRKTSSDPPPPPPYDIVLRRKEYRVYLPKGSDGLKIAAQREFVYYHVRKTCVLKKVDTITSSDISVPNEMLGAMGRLHKEQLKKEFGLSFKTD